MSNVPWNLGFDHLTDVERRLVADQLEELCVDVRAAADDLRLEDSCGAREFLECAQLHSEIARRVVEGAENRQRKKQLE